MSTRLRTPSNEPAAAEPAGEGRTPALSVSNMTVSYQQRPAVRSVSFELADGCMAAIVGPNGAGKTTLINAILGLQKADAGRALIYGEPLSRMRSQVAYVPQKESVDWDFPVTVFETTLMGRYGRLGYFGRPNKKDRQAVLEALEVVGMQEYRDRHIRMLSGGQQQRVFIARALCQEARLFFMDEPFAGVDAKTEKALFALLQKLKGMGKTMVMVNHNLDILDRFDTIVMINGRLVACGPYSEVWTDQNKALTYGGQSTLIQEAESWIRRKGGEA